MNTVDVSCEGVEPPGWLDRFIRFALRALDELDIDSWELSVILCNDAFIRDLNFRFRGKDEATDVLSFPQELEGRPASTGIFYAGDIVISLDMLRTNALEFAVGEEEELKRLLVHGILHLAGHDHSDNSPLQPMLELQETILSRLTEERLF